jgi:alginate O-acetyltransferase complex protein AlgI
VNSVVFSSVAFLFLFLPLTVMLHFAAHVKLRDIVLLGASFAFYVAGEPHYFWVLLASLAMNYLAGVGMALVRDGRRLAIVSAAVVANLLVLFVFKYAHFALGWFMTADGSNSLLSNIALPLGVSFFTFHGISYVVDVYRRVSPPQLNITRFGLYLLFFPQLIAGPIVRYHSVAAQLETRRPGWDDIYEGFCRFTVGLSKKVIIANQIGVVADAMFATPARELDFACAWLGAVAYALQIYFDFSGYSDMAIGLARVFGVRFPENFNYPYISQSITEFWRRWHISLSLWFRDYVYIPLGGNRRGAARTYLNLATVFLLCGLWHGASGSFVVWGLYFGVFLILERALSGRMPRLPAPLRHAYALAVVLVGWVIFRSPDLTYAGDFLLAMVTPGLREGYVRVLYSLEPGMLAIFGAAIVFSTPLAARLAAAAMRRQETSGQPLSLAREWALAGAVVSTFVVSLSFVVSSTYNPFIYFRF